MISISNNHLKHYYEIKRESAILKMELADHLNIAPKNNKEGFDGFYKINRYTAERELKQRIEIEKEKPSRLYHS